MIKNAPSFDAGDVGCFSLVCREVHKLVCADLHWDVVNVDSGPGDLLAAEWLSSAHEGCAQFLPSDSLLGLMK